jgi:hypothetical protein
MPRRPPSITTLVSAWVTCPDCGVIYNRSARCPCRSFREAYPPRGRIRGCLVSVSLAYGLVLGGLWVLQLLLRELW